MSESGSEAWQRIISLVRDVPEGTREQLCLKSPSPESALIRLEQWLRASANPSTVFDHLVAQPGLAQYLMMVLGASHQLADVLVQNPELSDVILDPGTLGARFSPERTLLHGRRLLEKSNSPSHQLDRLRFLRQSWTLRIAVNDLARNWPAEAVWLALSDLADVLVQLARESVWRQYAAEQGIDVDCPISVVGFGKLGGQELNYSSDVDLVYILPDDAPADIERHATRFCERLGRALSERMGRGALYRVDLRLRPFGGTGPIVSRMGAVEGYYARYAEAWEHLALIRSRVVAGESEIADRWERLREDVCFRPTRGEWVVEELFAMRTRIEEAAPEADLKRGPGGIRDVEFPTQILQMLRGWGDPTVRSRPTCDALRALDESGSLEHSRATELVEAYTFLRQVEHRCQIVGDQQTHLLPTDGAALGSLAKATGFDDSSQFLSELAKHRATARAYYAWLASEAPIQGDARHEVLTACGKGARAAATWIDSLPEPVMYAQALVANQGSLGRFAKVVQDASALVEVFRSDPSLTELLLTGEIEEEPATRFEIGLPPEKLAARALRLHTVACARWVLGNAFDLGETLSELADGALLSALGPNPAFDVWALGSFASCNLGPDSDLDVLLVARSGFEHAAAEEQAQQLTRYWQSARAAGMPFALDFRLRPEGRAGLLVRTLDGIRNYAEKDMETWERFALLRSRSLSATPGEGSLVREVLCAKPLDRTALTELVGMKRRMENERVSAHQRKRKVKLGWGGLDDIVWTVQLLVMRFSRAAGTTARIEDWLHGLAESGVLNAAETMVLRTGRAHHLSTRNWLWLLGHEEDLVPENPDKLAHLAHAMGFDDANAFLAMDMDVRSTVRALFEETLARLEDEL